MNCITQIMTSSRTLNHKGKHLCISTATIADPTQGRGGHAGLTERQALQGTQDRKQANQKHATSQGNASNLAGRADSVTKADTLTTLPASVA